LRLAAGRGLVVIRSVGSAGRRRYDAKDLRKDRVERTERIGSSSSRCAYRGGAGDAEAAL
jgi:hypothetical protein